MAIVYLGKLTPKMSERLTFIRVELSAPAHRCILCRSDLTLTSANKMPGSRWIRYELQCPAGHYQAVHSFGY